MTSAFKYLRRSFLILSTVTVFSAAIVSSHVAMAAESRYVSDILLINLRSGPSNSHRIIKQLKSGASLDVVSLSDDQKFYQVTTADGTTGWAPAQYLIAGKSARQQLAEARIKIATLSQEAGPIANQLDESKAKNSQLSSEIQLLASEKQSVSMELSALKKLSANAINIANSNKSLGENNQMLKNEIDVLTADNDRLKDKSDLEWFMNGVGAVGFGVLLALIIPRLKFKKRKSDW
jgi:SH3 domain protein